MFNITKLRRPLFMAVFPLKEHLEKYDVPRNPIPESENTPMGRVKQIFVASELEPISKELSSFINFTSTAAVIGIIVGGVMHTHGVAQQFIDNNEATRFYSQMDARRTLQNRFIVQFSKGGLKFGWRLTLFSGIFEFIRMILTAYNGKPSVLHYMIGAGTAGFLFKLSLGVKGSLVGLIFGSVLGAIGGSIILLFLKLTGMTIEDCQRIQSYWSYKRDSCYKEAIGKHLEEEYGESKTIYKESKYIREQLSSMKKENKEVDK